VLFVEFFLSLFVPWDGVAGAGAIILLLLLWMHVEGRCTWPGAKRKQILKGTTLLAIRVQKKRSAGLLVSSQIRESILGWFR